MFKFVAQESTNEYLGFMINDEPYAINISSIQEIIYIPAISRIPNVPPFVEGAINLRGRIIRVLNLRKWLQLPWKAFDKNSRIIILNLDNKTLGILVDRVEEVFTVDEGMKSILPDILQEESEIIYVKNIILKGENIYLEISPEIIRETA